MARCGAPVQMADRSTTILARRGGEIIAWRDASFGIEPPRSGLRTARPPGAARCGVAPSRWRARSRDRRARSRLAATRFAQLESLAASRSLSTCVALSLRRRSERSSASTWRTSSPAARARRPLLARRLLRGTNFCREWAAGSRGACWPAPPLRRLFAVPRRSRAAHTLPPGPARAWAGARLARCCALLRGSILRKARQRARSFGVDRSAC